MRETLTSREKVRIYKGGWLKRISYFLMSKLCIKLDGPQWMLDMCEEREKVIWLLTNEERFKEQLIQHLEGIVAKKYTNN